MKALIHFCLHQKLVVLLLLAFFIAWGVRVAPFDWDTGDYQRDPVAVDAIPDLGDNQQIVYTDWPGRSPQDIEDQVTYPLTVALLVVPSVKEVRSYSMFGSSYVYLIFEEDAGFDWSRAKVLEKLNSLPSDLIPEGVTPALGPEATGLGQIFWYVLEGRDPDGNPAGGWDLDELRAIQDWQVRYTLLAAEGVAEVASVGGYERQYQVDVDPNRLRAHEVTLAQVVDAVRKSNQEIGARNLAVNGVEYFLRGTGYIESIDDLSRAVVTVRDNVPITVGDVASVQLGPALRRGALDLNGADAVGGVVVARYGANPLEAIKASKRKMADIESALPIRPVIDWEQTSPDEAREFAASHGIDPAFDDAGLPVDESWLDYTRRTDRADWPDWLTTSKVTIVPFYDRSKLIDETLNTLDEALFQQVLVTIIVVVVMVLHFRSSLLISSMLPLAVLITFIAMKLANVPANIVALSGIAIAIGTVVDVGIVLTENILKHLDEADPDEPRITVIQRAVNEVSGAVTTSVLTTVVSFLPVFTMTGEEGRLFKPLAFTKTFALLASIVVALTIIPPAAHLLFGSIPKFLRSRRGLSMVLLGVAALISLSFSWLLALAFAAFIGGMLLEPHIHKGGRRTTIMLLNAAAAISVLVLLTLDWMPLGLDRNGLMNGVFVVLVVGLLLLAFKGFEVIYPSLLRWCLAHKAMFLSLPIALLAVAFCIWLGFPKVFAFIPKIAGDGISETRLWRSAAEKFPGLGREFRPALDEGSFLLMPTISPHASMDEAMESLRQLDAAVAAIPEVSQVVGKIGRVGSPLDPAPISMVETVINYHPEYKSDAKGRVLRFETDKEGNFIYDKRGQLIEDPDG
ncbi:MAG: efflux RND transporter permease subunit, partial [Akkermansiaceae bacterium]|nr:efflux RND transporter permease subunit [Akkermansiaceae bacterium]